MSPDLLRLLLSKVSAGETSVNDAMTQLAKLPFEDIGFARLDHHRHVRTGFPEAVWGADKTAEQIAGILLRYDSLKELCLVTRVSADKAQRIFALVSGTIQQDIKYDEVSKLLAVGKPLSKRGRGEIAVVAAGTSDIPVAEEAAVTAEFFGMNVRRIQDVGVAGLQRILSVRDTLEACEVVVVTAGMEGALPGVVKGLLSRPVIACPTSGRIRRWDGWFNASFSYVVVLFTRNDCCKHR